MLWLDVLSRITHVATAITLIGGSVFMGLVLMPIAQQKLAEDSLAKLFEGVIGRWKRFVHGGVLLFLLSGFYNYARAVPNHQGDGLYHALIGTKMILALVVFFLAAGLVGRSKNLAFLRENRRKYTLLLVMVAAVIVAISGFARVAT